jgi:hypothetical protein
MSIITTNPPRAAADGQRARVVTDAVVSSYIHEIARAGAVARRGVEQVAGDDTAGVMARPARPHECAGAGCTSAPAPRLVGRKPQSARRRYARGVQTATRT